MKDPVTDLCDRMHMLWLRYNVVFREPTHANPTYIPMAEVLVNGLLDEDKAAVTIARSLVDPIETDRADFWATPLGRLMFTAGAWPHVACTQTMAAAVLGCSRQWVSAMVAEGKLGPPPGGWGVSAEQVRSMLKARANRLLVDKTVKRA